MLLHFLFQRFVHLDYTLGDQFYIFCHASNYREMQRFAKSPKLDAHEKEEQEQLKTSFNFNVMKLIRIFCTMQLF